jgi:5-deoxy-D-glucuronate isomerase
VTRAVTAMDRAEIGRISPPYKHDKFVQPSEVTIDVVYYFQFEPRQGVGFMRVHTKPGDPDPFDVAYPVEHGDSVLITCGHHCPGYAPNYTWILAAEACTYRAWSGDPRHAWLKGA